ncbi:competence type IV pilus minor pilin ComGF [Bacillus atrophaeus]|uniref:competence type IV pilus minor pilin ComGF n=1 Tax=Bacillus atrophaeus TaxID=1452 RepID=UPI0038731A52
MSVYLLISGSLAMIFYQFLSRQLEGEGVKQEEWVISVEQMMNECKQAESVQLTDKGGGVLCKNGSGREILFEKYHKMIRKRVDGKGHVPILQHINTLKADIKNGMLILSVTSEDHKEYKTSFPIYTSLKGG